MSENTEIQSHTCKDCETCGCECAELCVTPWPCPCGDPEAADGE